MKQKKRSRPEKPPKKEPEIIQYISIVDVVLRYVEYGMTLEDACTELDVPAYSIRLSISKSEELTARYDDIVSGRNLV